MNQETSGGAVMDYDLARYAGNSLQKLCHNASYSAGWWHMLGGTLDLRELLRTPEVLAIDSRLGERLAKALVAEKLALIHSEISEGMEGHRKNKMDDKLPARTMLEVELADAVIRIADLAGALNLDLGGAIADKLAFNAVRPDHKLEARAKADGKAY